MSVFVTRPPMDQAMDGARILMTLGPLTVPPADAIRSAFRKLAVERNPLRLRYRTDPSGRWEHLTDTELSSRLHEIVRPAPGRLEGDSLDRWLADRLVDDLPVQFALSESYVAISIDHTLFDAQAAVRLPVLLFDTASGREVSKALATSSKAPLVRALLATFGVSPRSWNQLVRNIRDHRVRQQELPLPLSATPTERNVPLRGGPTATRHVFGSCDAATMRLVRRWGRDHELSTVTTLVYLVSGAMRSSGIAVSGQAYVLVDLRRYLPANVSMTGNFIASLPVRTGTSGSAVALADDVKAGVAAGRPLASVAARLARQRLRPAARHLNDLAVPVPAHAGLSMSVLPSLPGWEGLPWRGDESSRSIRLATDSAEPGTIGWIVATSGRRTYFSATYRADVFPDEQMNRAIALATVDPLQLLDEVP